MLLIMNFFSQEIVFELWNWHVHICGPCSIMSFVFPSDHPTIQSSQPTVYGVQGDSVQLNCTFDGLPVPNITWTSPNGSVLTSQSHIMLQSTNTSTMLTISGSGLGDSGTYTCNATNSIGVSSASIQLVVKCKLRNIVL